MRVNNMDAINEKVKDNFIYYFMAVACGVFVGYLLIFVFKIFTILGHVLVKYWWAVLVGIPIILLIRRRKK